MSRGAGRRTAPSRPASERGTGPQAVADVAEPGHRGDALAARPEAPPTGEPAWHHTAVVYEVYLRSFADGNGDGVGDIAGLRARLPYLRELGVDALWLAPWYVSPMADGGYDVADYRDIDPVFGTLADAEALLTEAHAHNLRIIIDIVPNHCSARHPWF
ncbi:MAG: hypothetical protein J2P29_16075, partial [Actinobacteria bacterium]|nr:hypothetical protein [Actinomycetota bacterium]